MGTARDAGLAHCHSCRLLSSSSNTRCPRCDATLHTRKPDSIQRTWALLLGATLLYLPANIFPIMVISRLGRAEADTILSGVQALIHAGMYPIAILVFFASITVPVLKILGLTYLLISVQRGFQGRGRQRTVLYRVISSVGRWSMIDMFMISILVALVQLGEVATIEPGIGATCFAGVVVITIFAANAFDPRVMWDRLEEGM